MSNNYTQFVQNSFHTTHRDLNVVDPGNKLPLEYNRDLLAGSMQ